MNDDEIRQACIEQAIRMNPPIKALSPNAAAYQQLGGLMPQEQLPSATKVVADAKALYEFFRPAIPQRKKR